MLHRRAQNNPSWFAWTLALAGIFTLSCGGNGSGRTEPDAASDGGVVIADAPVADVVIRGPGTDAPLGDGRLAADTMTTPTPDGGGKDASSLDARSADRAFDLMDLLDVASLDGKRSPDAATSDGKAGCTFGNRTYAVGETFKNDCNTCTCQAGGNVACTLMACPVDGAATDAASECKVSTALTFGTDGGNALYHDVNSIDTAGVLTITRTMSGRGGGDGGSTSCSQALPACGTAGAVTAATLTADLADPVVKAGFTSAVTPFYGVDQRPVDGPAFSVTANGHTILVGAACPAGSTSCSLPAGVQRLVDHLKTITTTGLAADVCKKL
jgi:hypothetical protein